MLKNQVGFFHHTVEKVRVLYGYALVGEIVFNISCGAPARPETCLDSHLRAWLNVEKSGWIFYTIMLKKYGFCTGTLLVGENVFNISCGAPPRPGTF